jgi:hypothetical protein
MIVHVNHLMMLLFEAVLIWTLIHAPALDFLLVICIFVVLYLPDKVLVMGHVALMLTVGLNLNIRAELYLTRLKLVVTVMCHMVIILRLFAILFLILLNVGTLTVE